jgi:N-acetyl-beta-hexosaminidase
MRKWLCLAVVHQSKRRVFTFPAMEWQVVPEIDMPGHSRAAVVSMEARADTTYRLMDPEDTTELLTVQFYDKKYECATLCLSRANRKGRSG